MFTISITDLLKKTPHFIHVGENIAVFVVLFYLNGLINILLEAISSEMLKVSLNEPKMYKYRLRAAPEV
jgi:hypothetical protein